MPWYAWVLVGVIGLSSLISVSLVGKPRKPLEPGAVVVILLINGLLVWGIVSLGVRA